MDFSTVAINRVFNLVHDDNEAYRALSQHTDYQMMMRVLTNSRCMWK